jgi:hypothetical protein
MCLSCDHIKKAIDSSAKESIDVYYELGNSFQKAIEDEKLELVAGDCKINKVQEELKSEQHFTVSHRFKCINCQETFFWGACIRGAPIYKYGEKTPPYRILKKTHWGRLGTAFENRKWWQFI